MAIEDIFRGSNSGYIGAIGVIVILAIIWFLLKRSNTGRLGLEKEERKIENQERKLTEQQIAMEKEVNRIIDGIIRMLGEINETLPADALEFKMRIGRTSLNVNQALRVLIAYLEKLIGTGEGITVEETDITHLRNFWSIARQGLMSNSTIVQSDINRIDREFEKLGVILKTEDVITQEKLQLAKKQYDLIVGERGVAQRVA